jgi:probable HAF family extracellular repeat protein
MFVRRRIGGGFVRSGIFRAAAAAFAMLAMAATSRAGISYTLQDLGTLPGWPSAYPSAINNKGQVTGNDYSNMPYSTAFLYSGATLTDLGTNGQVASVGTGINNAGQVVGYTTNSSGVQQGFLYTNGTMVNLTPSSSSTSGASGINDKGQVAGAYTSSSGQVHAALFFNGTVTDLGTLPGGTGSSATAINASGQVVGDSTFAGTGLDHAFLYSNGALQDLGTLGGANNFSSANAINAAGEVVGQSSTPGGADAFLYKNGTMYDLGTLPGPQESSATGINDEGDIVGESLDKNTQRFAAFLYADGTMYNLNDLLANGQGYLVTQATGINNAGQIIAYATTPSGAQNAVLLLPSSIPLPSAAWAALTCLPLILVIRRPASRAFARCRGAVDLGRTG